jgi:pyruvate-ferredoxin/flavodoxin oxidoreductase
MAHKITVDANEAVAQIAYLTNELIAIYPITPSSPMGEWADQWSSQKIANLWNVIPKVVEMQSEGGAAGALHGAVQAGCLGTTFTASQGLLLMIPNMYKIAGELTSCVIHVAARSLAAQALSIFGDHSDVMAARSTGWAMLASNSVQEAMDFALIAQASTLESRIPILHFFDGFRTSHEVMKVEELSIETIRAMISDNLVREHRARGLSPDHPVIRGTAQNPDVYFQARETVNPFYRACPTIIQNQMNNLANLTGRQYKLFEYIGDPNAERLIVLMGSGAETVRETIEVLNSRNESVGALLVRLFRPFSVEHFIDAVPKTIKRIAVLDRTKEPGSAGEPLYQDVVTAIHEASLIETWPFSSQPLVIGGRYGLSSKEFTPAMVKSIYDELLKKVAKNHFTVGIRDDVTHTSLDFNENFKTENTKSVRAVFYGLGSDGTVGANKNSIKIIGEETENYAQGYFVYDSKKSGSVTVSHLRFGPEKIHSTYLIQQASFVACHQFTFLEGINVLEKAEHGATFLLNSPYGPDEVWDHLPEPIQKEILIKKLHFYVIDASRVAHETGMDSRINTILQTCFFAISGILPRDEAINSIKSSIEKTYGKRGEGIVQKNFAAVDSTLANLYEVKVPEHTTSRIDFRPAVPSEAPEFVRNVTARIIEGKGDDLPVSALPVDGTYPTGTTQWEKRNITAEIPVWDEEICIQCGKCILVCPHSVIRAKVYEPQLLKEAPATFKSAPAKWREFSDKVYTLQIAPEDCTGCTLCVEICPVKSKSNVSHKAINMRPQLPLREQERQNWDFFLNLPETNNDHLSSTQVKDVQLLRPLFEFSGACAGCGETPYLKLLSQLFGDRAIIANATGCSSIYGGNLPTTPWTSNKFGRGPAWSNSLFEDNAEFGLGIRLAIDQQTNYARELVKQKSSTIGEELVEGLLASEQTTEKQIQEQRERVSILRKKLENDKTSAAHDLNAIADSLVKRSIWIVGGDGWAYDIGYGGLDHVLASGVNVNLLVLDTEVYSNTGGQMSKATPRAAVAKFAAGGKQAPKKDLAMMAMSYGNVYVARVAMGGNDAQTLKAFVEAERHQGPSLIIAYSHCIAHGYDLAYGMEQQKKAVLSGYWPLLRFNPDLNHGKQNPLQLDSKAPSLPLEKYIYNETRYTMLKHSDRDMAEKLLHEAQKDVHDCWERYEQLAQKKVEQKEDGNG